MESALAYRLRTATGSDKLTLAAEAVSLETADIIYSELVRSHPEALEALPENAGSVYLRARVATEHGNLEEAARCWDRLFQLTPQRDPFHLLTYARVLSDLGKPQEAALILHRALIQVPKYAFFPRAEKLIKKLAGQVDSHFGNAASPCSRAGPPACWPRCCRRSACATGSKSRFTKGCMVHRAGDSRSRQRTGAVPPEHRVPDRAAGAICNCAPVTESEPEFAESIVERQQSYWQRLSEQFGCHVVQFAYDYPAQEAYGYLARSLPGGRARVIQRVNTRLLDNAPSYVSILDTPASAARSGIGQMAGRESVVQFPAASRPPRLCRRLRT